MMILGEMISGLRSGPVFLQFEEKVPVDPRGGLVPFYHFHIVNQEQAVVGHINFRVGDTRHVMLCAGHIGYGILLQYRGRSYAYHACRAMVPLVKQYYAQVILTADPLNVVSIQIIEKLGAVFLDEIDVPPDDPAYASGARKKRRYQWTL